jgi:NDP-sugar pyrophosphorylase family protein
MQALILAGGKGTRLRPLTIYTPKPIVPLVNRPFLLYQIDVLRKAGIEEIVLSLGYQPDKIEQVLGDGSDYGVRLTFLAESNPLGTAGAYRFAADGINETTIVLNGDILTNADLGKIVDHHRSNKADATLALAPVANPSQYGLVEMDKDDRVKRFVEKPSAEKAPKKKLNTINAGIYVLEPSVRDLIAPDENRSFEYHVFPELLKKERAVFGYTLKDEYWRDVGNPKSYLDAHMELLSGIVGFEFERTRVPEIAHTAMVDDRSVVGEDCTIKPNAIIKNSVLGRGVHVEEKAIIENSVIWPHTRVSTGAEISGSVIARSCHIGRNAIVGNETVLGDKASIPDYSRI